MNNERKIEKFINQEILRNLQDIVIFQENDGSYKLFNAYTISKNSQKEYIVTGTTTITPNRFYVLKNAVSWCIFDKRNKMHEARRIAELDNKLVSVDVDIHIHQTLYKKAKKPDDKLIYLAKLNEDRLRKKNVIKELEDYVTESNIWQSKRFNRKPQQ
jgi:hypothetical protein